MDEKIGCVIKVLGLYYTVLWKDDEINCNLRGKIRKDKTLVKYSNPVAVGDKVAIELNDDGTGVINRILPRKNIFSRRSKGKKEYEDIIAANLDIIVIMQSFKNPRLNLRFVDRVMLRAYKEGLDVILCINKLDLAAKEQVDYIKEYFKNVNIKILMMSVINGQGLKQFLKEIHSKVSILIGYSGVGKSTLLNNIFPDLQLKVSEVSGSTGKGRHATTNVQMIPLGKKMALIDTPGLREFGLMDIEYHMLGMLFPGFNRYINKCEFNPCTHDHEPNCAIKRNVEKKNIFEDRYISYLNILHSLKKV